MSTPVPPGGTVYDRLPPHFPSPSDNTPTHIPDTIPIVRDGVPFQHPNPFKDPLDGDGNKFQFSYTGLPIVTLDDRKVIAADLMSKLQPQTQEDITNLLQCDDHYCEDYDSRFQLAHETLWTDIHPHSYTKWQQCAETGRPQDECREIFDYGMRIVKPRLKEVLSAQRMSHPDPLVDYDGTVYQSPFWFEGAGEIWRRVDHGSFRIRIAECLKLRKEVEQCLLDHHRDGTVDYCYRKYQHSLICEPGFNCPYLRWPMLQCFRRVQGVDYDRFRACVKLVPNYASCKFGPAPQWSLHNNGKFLPDLSEFDNPSGEIEFTQFDESGNALPPRGFYIPEDH